MAYSTLNEGRGYPWTVVRPPQDSESSSIYTDPSRQKNFEDKVERMDMMRVYDAQTYQAINKVLRSDSCHPHPVGLDSRAIMEPRQMARRLDRLSFAKTIPPVEVGRLFEQNFQAPRKTFAQPVDISLNNLNTEVVKAAQGFFASQEKTTQNCGNQIIIDCDEEEIVTPEKMIKKPKAKVCKEAKHTPQPLTNVIREAISSVATFGEEELPNAKKSKGRPKKPKDGSFASIYKDLIVQLANKISTISLTPSGKHNRSRADKEFGKVVTFIKEIPHFLCRKLRTGKYYKTAYRGNRVKCLKGLLEPFLGFLKLLKPIEEFEVQKEMFLDFICIYHPEKKVAPLLADLKSEISISEEKYVQLSEFLGKRKETGIDKNVVLCQENQSLRLCAFLTKELMQYIDASPKRSVFKNKLDTLLEPLCQESSCGLSSP